MTPSKRPKYLSPVTTYLILEFSASLFFSLVFTVHMLYQVMVVELNPLQLVLVGTILEVTIFVFEIPTGIVADVKGRRLSIIIGNALIGLGFVLEGFFPLFRTIALAQVLWGLGYTFTSGSTQAWIADEVGSKRAGEAFVQGAQAARIGALVAIPISVGLGLVAINIPIVVGGALLILLALFLSVVMTEDGFTPILSEDRTNWGVMLKTLHDAWRLARRQPLLLILLAIGLFYGLYSEGFDRLWTAHLLESFHLPYHDLVEPVVWFGAIRAVMQLVSLGATEIARRKVNTELAKSLGRTLLVVAALLVTCLGGFALTQSFWVAVVLYWLIGGLRNVGYPLYSAWYNLLIDDPQVRATMFSVTGQVDAIGQIAGGPGVGAIGNASIRAALLTSALILSPVLPLYAFALKRTRHKETSGQVIP